MPRTPSHVVVSTLLTAVLGAGALALVIVVGPTDAATSPGPPRTGQAELLTAGRCGPTLAGADARAADPTDALVRTPGGRVRVVPFERGWEIYTGRRAGELLAVCDRAD